MTNVDDRKESASLGLLSFVLGGWGFLRQDPAGDGFLARAAPPTDRTDLLTIRPKWVLCGSRTGVFKLSGLLRSAGGESGFAVCLLVCESCGSHSLFRERTIGEFMFTLFIRL